MTAPAFVNNGTNLSQGTGLSNTPALPGSRSNGNLLIALGTWRTTSGTVACSTSGWVKLGQRTAGSGVTGLICGVFYRFVDGSETSPTITFGTSTTNDAVVLQYSGTDQTTPFGTAQTAGVTASPIVLPSITTTRNDSKVFYAIAQRSATDIATPSGYTENLDTLTGGGWATGDITAATSGTVTGSVSATGPAIMAGFHVELLSPLVALSRTSAAFF